MTDLKVLLVILSTLMQMLISPVYSQQNTRDKRTIIISSIENDYIHGIIKNIIKNAYDKAGIKVVFHDLPARRSLESANIGETDGDLARIENTEKTYTNLVKISCPVLQLRNSVFTINTEREIKSMQDLKDLHVGIRTGIRHLDLTTRGLDKTLAKDLNHLFQLLVLNRVDVVIADSDMGRIEISRNFKNNKIHVISKSFPAANLYHYLHKRNKDLAAVLEKILLEMNENGEIDSIREQSIQEILRK